ncbi:MAG: hypothetical protein B7Y08_09215 [Rhodospirillales bacterium 24-66-33]|nr:MAG: hypothetical protein B7Y57_06025 [Rhodospirillales bacterium 35-66-84]OYZ95481.1 MAG: hypothetical protein B7Y08_09215 [Rhodospirillales bacterium 24-66-33]OZB26745.1 MAG: hypothetical protein B7X63_06375 [Rhodospirillales bacterium 39-66-50]
MASWPRSASARAATSSACSAVRSAAASFRASFRAAGGPGGVPGGVPGVPVTSGIVGMRLSVVPGGVMTERSDVAGGSITPPDRPSSREVTPGALSGEAVGGSVAMFWVRARSRTWSRQPSAAARPGQRARAKARRRMCIHRQTTLSRPRLPLNCTQRALTYRVQNRPG